MRKSWSPLNQSIDSDDLRRRFDSEIGRELVRERRMNTELERLRADSSPCGSPSKSETLMCTSPPSSSPLVTSQVSAKENTTAMPLIDSDGSLTSLSSATSSGIEPLSLSHPLPSGEKTKSNLKQIVDYNQIVFNLKECLNLKKI